MKELANKGSPINNNKNMNLKRGTPIQERWARLLHQEANVPEGPCGFEKLEKFQEYLGPQAYQLIVVEPSKCLIVFKDPTYNEAPHVIGLVKYNGHYDGLRSIPTLMNRSYYCRHCDQSYNVENASNHNCKGQNCSACYHKKKPVQTLPPGPNLPCIVPIATVCFLGKIVFKRIKPKDRKEETTIFVRDGRNAHSAEQNIKPIPKNHTNATM